MNRYENGAPSQKELEARSVNVGRSAHDFSFTHAGNTLLGIIAPVDVFDVVPNEDLDISITALLEFRNPAVRPIYNGFRVYFHTYYNRLSDLWEGAKNFIDNGRSGKLSLNRPNLIYHVTNYDESGYVNANTPLSLLNFMGLPAEYKQLKNSSSVLSVDFPPLRSFQACISSPSIPSTIEKLGESVSYFPADIAFAYQRNWRDFYSNKNLLQNNKFWFPDNEDHFILSYSCEEACAINYEDEALENISLGGVPVDKRDAQYFNLASGIGSTSQGYTSTPEANNPETVAQPSPSSAGDLRYLPNLSAIKFHQFRGDRFTTSSPFVDLIRGEIPTLAMNQSTFLKLTNGIDGQTFNRYEVDFADDSVPADNIATLRYLEASSQDVAPSYGRLGVVNPNTSITMSDIYTLETLTAFKRKMGLTNGDYNETVKAQFGVSPHAHDRRGTYIGGFYQDFALSTVVQQSESGSTPLGTKASNGVSAGSGNIGSFHVPDYGWISTYMFILSDVYYTQGKPRMFSKKNSIDMYFPLFNNLPAQHIRNDELFISGSESTDSAPFSYEARYEEYKGRNNRVSGFMGLSHSVASYDSARIMSRRFSSLPTFNNKFITMIPENVDMEVFSVVDEPPFDFNIGVSVRRVFPGPYVALEGSLSSPAIA